MPSRGSRGHIDWLRSLRAQQSRSTWREIQHLGKDALLLSMLHPPLGFTAVWALQRDLQRALLGSLSQQGRRLIMWKEQGALSADFSHCQEMLHIDLLDSSAEQLCCLLLWDLGWHDSYHVVPVCLVVLRLGKTVKPVGKCFHGGSEPRLPFLAMATCLFVLFLCQIGAEGGKRLQQELETIQRESTSLVVSCYSPCPGRLTISGLSPWLWMKLGAG